MGSTSLYSNSYVAYGNASLTTSGAWTVVPGMSVTFTVPAGVSARVILIGNVGAMSNSALNDRYSCTDIAIYRGGALLTDGGYVRISIGDALLDAADGNNAYQFPTISAIETVPAGTYTYDLRAWQQCSGGNAVTAIVGGNNTSVLQGTLIVLVLYQ